MPWLKWTYRYLLLILIFGVSTSFFIINDGSDYEEHESNAIPIYQTHSCSKWGFYGHKRINRMATFTLPPEMFTFYKNHIEFITEHAVDPDKRRYAVDGEAPKHYIDIDHYVKKGEDPFEVVPKKWGDAVIKYTEDTLQAYGIVPWNIDWMEKKLTRAFKAKNFDLILKYSAEIGHYIGDAHVPLHTTENYNGQMTNQKGIHGFWESRLPELNAENYNYFTGKAKFVDNVLDEAWTAVKHSHFALDSVLNYERELTLQFNEDKKYAYEQRGQSTIKVYSQEFSDAYHEKLNGMVERRMRKSIIVVGSIWYTAWVNAGRPNLDEFTDKKISDSLQNELKNLDLIHQSGKIKGREHQD